MAQGDPSSEERTQPIRRVYEHLSSDANTPGSLSEVFHLECNYDDVSGKDIILWDDILAAFKDVVHVRAGAKILPFLKGRDFKLLDPLRIAAVPGVTLDVVVAGQLVNPQSTLLEQAQPTILAKDLSLESLQKSSPDPPQEHDITCSNTSASSTIRRNPTYGLIEVALENYTHIDNPATAPARRRPQAIPNDQSSAQDEHDDPSKPQHSPNKIQQQARSPQETASGIARDFVQAVMKAVQGDKDAQVAVGDMYKDGEGVTQDYQAAMDWYLKAAEQDDPVGQRKVGYLYDFGLGVTQNHSTAMEWYLLAAKQGSSPAQCNIGLLYKLGEGVPRSYSKAMEWYLKAADQGNAAGQESIGQLHQDGLGVPQDYAKAMEWYLKAADQGDARAQCDVGYMYEFGLGVPRDDAQAVEWFRKAAEQGLATAQYNLGNMYKVGRGVPKDQAKAMEWYKKAADQGDEDAKNELDKLERQISSAQVMKKKPGLFKKLFN